LKSTLVLAGALLALGFASMSMAQDELPKDAPPPPKPTVVTPPAQELEGPSALPPGSMLDEPVAVLQALDKITARVKRLPVHVGQVGKFGTLSILVDACRKAPPEDSPESAAFLKITDGKSDTPQTVFSGWMFASTPALSAMDHPVYDISVVDCIADSTAPASSAPPAPVVPAPAAKPAAAPSH
jgi:hypothetical protein